MLGHSGASASANPKPSKADTPSAGPAAGISRGKQSSTSPTTEDGTDAAMVADGVFTVTHLGFELMTLHTRIASPVTLQQRMHQDPSFEAALQGLFPASGVITGAALIAYIAAWKASVKQYPLTAFYSDPEATLRVYFPDDRTWNILLQSDEETLAALQSIEGDLLPHIGQTMDAEVANAGMAVLGDNVIQDMFSAASMAITLATVHYPTLVADADGVELGDTVYRAWREKDVAAASTMLPRVAEYLLLRQHITTFDYRSSLCIFAARALSAVYGAVATLSIWDPERDTSVIRLLRQMSDLVKSPITSRTKDGHWLHRAAKAYDALPAATREKVASETLKRAHPLLANGAPAPHAMLAAVASRLQLESALKDIPDVMRVFRSGSGVFRGPDFLGRSIHDNALRRGCMQLREVFTRMMRPLLAQCIDPRELSAFTGEYNEGSLLVGLMQRESYAVGYPCHLTDPIANLRHIPLEQDTEDSRARAINIVTALEPVCGYTTQLLADEIRATVADTDWSDTPFTDYITRVSHITRTHLAAGRMPQLDPDMNSTSREKLAIPGAERAIDQIVANLYPPPPASSSEEEDEPAAFTPSAGTFDTQIRTEAGKIKAILVRIGRDEPESGRRAPELLGIARQIITETPDQYPDLVKAVVALDTYQGLSERETAERAKERVPLLPAKESMATTWAAIKQRATEELRRLQLAESANPPATIPEDLLLVSQVIAATHADASPPTLRDEHVTAAYLQLISHVQNMSKEDCRYLTRVCIQFRAILRYAYYNHNATLGGFNTLTTLLRNADLLVHDYIVRGCDLGVYGAFSARDILSQYTKTWANKFVLLYPWFSVITTVLSFGGVAEYIIPSGSLPAAPTLDAAQEAAEAAAVITGDTIREGLKSLEIQGTTPDFMFELARRVGDAFDTNPEGLLGRLDNFLHNTIWNIRVTKDHIKVLKSAVDALLRPPSVGTRLATATAEWGYANVRRTIGTALRQTLYASGSALTSGVMMKLFYAKTSLMGLAIAKRTPATTLRIPWHSAPKEKKQEKNQDKKQDKKKKKAAAQEPRDPLAQPAGPAPPVVAPVPPVAPDALVAPTLTEKLLGLTTAVTSSVFPGAPLAAAAMNAVGSAVASARADAVRGPNALIGIVSQSGESIAQFMTHTPGMIAQQIDHPAVVVARAREHDTASYMRSLQRTPVARTIFSQTAAKHWGNDLTRMRDVLNEITIPATLLDSKLPTETGSDSRSSALLDFMTIAAATLFVGGVIAPYVTTNTEYALRSGWKYVSEGAASQDHWSVTAVVRKLGSLVGGLATAYETGAAGYSTTDIMWYVATSIIAAFVMATITVSITTVSRRVIGPPAISAATKTAARRAVAATVSTEGAPLDWSGADEREIWHRARPFVLLAREILSYEPTVANATKFARMIGGTLMRIVDVNIPTADLDPVPFSAQGDPISIEVARQPAAPADNTTTVTRIAPLDEPVYPVGWELFESEERLDRATEAFRATNLDISMEARALLKATNGIFADAVSSFAPTPDHGDWQGIVNFVRVYDAIAEFPEGSQTPDDKTMYDGIFRTAKREILDPL